MAIKKRPIKKKTVKKKRRALLSDDSDSGGLYFSNENTGIQFIPSGCQLLDNVLGGGYAIGRMINLVGDKSSGKTLLAIEACANFHNKFPNGELHYIEVESAFDKKYAGSLGMPIEATIFQEEMDTVEDVFGYLQAMIAEKTSSKSTEPTLVVIDSLDALSDTAEKGREIDKGTFGASKAKQISEIFRRINKPLSKANITLFIISQIRDKMNVMFGKKTQRSGGRAMDFYASQVIWLAEIGKIKKTYQKVVRPIGVNVRAKCEKNKIGLPYRECEFPILFGYGVDDIAAGLAWLKATGKLKEIGLTEKDHKSYASSLSPKEEAAFRVKLNKVIAKQWKEVEVGFMPSRRKY